MNVSQSDDYALVRWQSAYSGLNPIMQFLPFDHFVGRGGLVD